MVNSKWSATSSTTMGFRRHGQGGTWGHLPLHGNVVQCFCISCYSKTLRRQIIYALFSQPIFCWGSIPGPCWGTFVPRPLICQPLEKNPACPHINNNNSNKHLQTDDAVTTVIRSYQF